MRSFVRPRAAHMGMLLVPLALTTAAQANVVSFNSLTPGTQYSTPLETVRFTEDAIPVSFRAFRLTGGSIFTNFAQVSGPSAGFATTHLNMNNINAVFDLTGLGFAVTQVTFQYIDQGGFENLQINNSGFYVGELTGAPSTFNGVDVSVGPAVSGVRTVSLTGANITSFAVGGQEFRLDQVVAVPTPGVAGVLGVGGIMALGARRRRR